MAPGTVGAARLVRQWAQLSQSGDVVEVEAFNPASTGSDVYLASLDLEVRPRSIQGEFLSAHDGAQIAYWFEKNATGEQYDADQLMQVFVRAYNGLIFTPGQLLVFDFHGQNLKATVKSLHNLSLGGNSGGRIGMLTPDSEVNFVKDPASAIKIKSSAKK